MRLLWQTGVRAGEAAAIELDHIDRDERTIRIWAEKVKDRRTVYYDESLGFLLDRWLDAGGRAGFYAASKSPYLFVSQGNEQLDRHDVNDVVKATADRADIQEVYGTDQRGYNRYRIMSHVLRHGHAVAALKVGIDVRTVQRHLGHENIEMTMEYLELIETDVRDAYRAKFNPAGPAQT